MKGSTASMTAMMTKTRRWNALASRPSGRVAAIGEASVDAAAEDILVVPSGEAGQAVRPNRPAGFTSSTSTMMTKITVEEASG